MTQSIMRMRKSNGNGNDKGNGEGNTHIYTHTYTQDRGKTNLGKSKDKPSQELSSAAAMMGRAGGRIGGKRRLETLTPARRSEIASRAAQARWARVPGRV